MTTRVLPCCLLPAACCLLLAAADPVHESAEDTIRSANAAFLRGERDAAEKLYAAAEERTADPGLVAFNKAAVLFARGEFRDAELHYARVLKDKACPPDRAAKAWFNRGTCLVRRGGPADVYRSAIACFEKCLELNPPDPPREAARDNLELAKLLWAEANKKEAKPKSPNEPVEEEATAEPPPPTEASGANDPGAPEQGPNQAQKIDRVPGPAPNGDARKTDAQAVGNKTNLPQLKDDEAAQPLSPEDTLDHLRFHRERMRKDRRAMLDTLYGPDRPGVKDW